MKDFNNSLTSSNINPASVVQLQHSIKKDVDEVNPVDFKKVQRYVVKSSGTGNPEKTKLIIKNMVSIRCIMVVKSVLENVGLLYNHVKLGEVEISGVLSEEKRSQLKDLLFKFDFTMVEDQKRLLAEKVKKIIFEFFFDEKEPPKVKFSDYLSEHLNHNYPYLSKIFSQVKGMPIGHFILSNKIERVKEMLLQGEITLTEIANRLHYSSVAHLSNQFKQITGFTPTHFRGMSHH